MGNQQTEDPELALRKRQEEERKQAEARAQAQASQQQNKGTTQQTTQSSGTTTASRIPAPEKGVTYKVQITAAHREVGRSYFKARHSYSGDFQIERHEGWIKYVTGSHTAYKEARDQRVAYVQAGHNFPGPFVTAYNNGSRITVQEALLLSAQQWIP